MIKRFEQPGPDKSQDFRMNEVFLGKVPNILHYHLPVFLRKDPHDDNDFVDACVLSRTLLGIRKWVMENLIFSTTLTTTTTFICHTSVIIIS